MVQETIVNYKSILANLPKAIAVSGYRKDYIAKTWNFASIILSQDKPQII
jgi:hypothetical protein